jgi:hypothetical protein
VGNIASNMFRVGGGMAQITFLIMIDLRMQGFLSDSNP